VTRDLVPTRPELFTQQAAEEAHANLAEVAHAPLPLGIEASYKVDLPITTERHPQRFDHLLEQRQQPRSAVSMAMRVDVRGQPAHQCVEVVELTLELLANCSPIAQVELPLVLTPDVPMQSYR